MMKVLLTGITGYLGSNLARELVTRGNKVIGVIRPNSNFSKIANFARSCDLIDIEELLYSGGSFNWDEIDIVVHAATNYGRQDESIHQLVSTNLLFPINIMEKIHPETTFINVSSSLAPEVSAYALSKNQFEAWGRFMALKNNFRFINTKLEHLYGPGDDESKFPTHIINSCIRNVPEIWLTTGEQYRDFIFIEDAVNAYLAIINNLGTLHKGFIEVQVGSGIAIPVKDFVMLIHKLSQSVSRMHFGAIPYRDGECMYMKADTSNLLALGWVRKNTLEDGLKKTIDFAKSRH